MNLDPEEGFKIGRPAHKLDDVLHVQPQNIWGANPNPPYF